MWHHVLEFQGAKLPSFISDYCNAIPIYDIFYLYFHILEVLNVQMNKIFIWQIIHPKNIWQFPPSLGNEIKLFKLVSRFLAAFGGHRPNFGSYKNPVLTVLEATIDFHIRF